MFESCSSVWPIYGARAWLPVALWIDLSSEECQGFNDDRTMLNHGQGLV
jgi:hypothetical protein